MDVKSTTTLTNRAVLGTDNNSAEGHRRYEQQIENTLVKPDTSALEEESVKVYISKAGLKKSQTVPDEELATQSDRENLSKMIEGLSSQVINGNFSMTDRLGFQLEIKKLAIELDRLNGDGISFSKTDNEKLSQKITDLTKTISDAATYNKSARAMFVIKNQSSNSKTRTNLDIAI